MANILLPTQQLRLQEGYAKGADNVGMLKTIMLVLLMQV